MEAHAGPDHHVAVMPEPQHPIAAGPAGRHADADEIAAMVAPVVRESGPVDDALPRRIDVAGKHAVPECIRHRVEGVAGNHRHPASGGRRFADEDQPAERRVIAGDAARKLEEHRVAAGEALVRPGGVLLPEPFG